MAFSRVHWALCVLIAAIVAWVLYSYVGINWELLSTKHYFPARYYGGYADTILYQNGTLFTVQKESWPCLDYLAKFLARDSAYYARSLNVDRMYTCGFLPSLVVRLAFGSVQLVTAFVAFNFMLWIASIALTYGIVRALAADRAAALAGAAIAAGYPIYGLMFESWKTQDAGVVLLLAWVYVDKAIWPRMGWTERSLLLVLTFAVTMLASGAAYYILAYIVAWYLFLVLFEAPARRDAGLTIVTALLAFAIAKLANNAMMAHYNIISTISVYHAERILPDSLSFLWAALSGGDTSSLRFMNYPGASFLTSVFPWYVALWFKANPVIIVVPLIGLFVIRELRPLVLVIPALFLIGHAPAIITGWVYYYGYSSAPATQLLIVATAFCLGRLFDSKLAIGHSVATAGLLTAVYFFNVSPAANLKNFFTEDRSFPVDRRMYVYHDDQVVRYW